MPILLVFFISFFIYVVVSHFTPDKTQKQRNILGLITTDPGTITLYM